MRALAQLPPNYHEASLVDFPENTLKEILMWRCDPRQGLVLFGKAGRGKTYLAAAIVRSLILIREETLFRRAFQFFSEVRHAMTAGEDESIMAKYVAPHYLFIDDFDTNCSDFERRFFLELTARRIDFQRPTCITTNATLQEIGKSLDERIASRLSEFRWIHLDGEDLRRFPRAPRESFILTISNEIAAYRDKLKQRLSERFGGAA